MMKKNTASHEKSKSKNIVWLVLPALMMCFILMGSSAKKLNSSIGGIKADTSAPKPVKKYSVSYTEDEWQMRLNWLTYIGQQLKKTDLPAREVGFMTDSLITRLQMELINQIQPQIPKDTPAIKK